ncbi:Two-component response regulator SSK1p, partial [Elasticomyces elasticus]
SRPVQERRQSLVAQPNTRIIKTLLDTSQLSRQPFSPPPPATATTIPDYFASALPTNIASMLHRKIWVRRPGASATQVQIREDDLVDDVRDMILRKYMNSLGRSFDSPDVTLRIVSRHDNQKDVVERQLGPEEDMCQTLDAYFPGGQTVDEALIIHVPQRRTPKPSPRIQHVQSYAALDEYRPVESGNEYFPPMPAILPASLPQTAASHESRASHHAHLPAINDHSRPMSVLGTSQLPPLPSPGAGSRRHHSHRPKFQRQHTSSPTIISHPPNIHTNAGAVAAQSAVHSNLVPNPPILHRNSARPRLDSSVTEHPLMNGGPPAPPLPTPPAPEALPSNPKIASTPPTPNASAPHRPGPPSRPQRARKPSPSNTNNTSSTTTKGAKTTNPVLPSSLLDGSVPPINVLIVEDNIINLKLLEAFMKRLKVRWQTAMNGQIAVDKWKLGGFHLVLMDIQLPIMSGLEATKEIRRLERVNGIGVFSSSSASSSAPKGGGYFGEDLGSQDEAGANGVVADKVKSKTRDVEGDKLNLKMEEGMFKSPVIIVALTASSLQSDRHEALAAGCNDFLTKPVNFVWLERKVKEWGCMQALIDFDGWRKWKDFAATDAEGSGSKEMKAKRDRKKRDGKRSGEGGLAPMGGSGGGSGSAEVDGER